MRVGLGYDIHRLEEDRSLFLGGVAIPYKKGLAGHSDGDVLIHSIMDAMLGAMAAGDIGQLFPDTDHQYKGISSLVLLERVFALFKEKNYKINNLDAVVIAQEPKIAPYIPQMRQKIARVLAIEVAKINIKATTPEKLNSLGAGEGIAAFAVVSICEEYQGIPKNH